ncbi:ferritin-like domain-containing protein [Sphingomonas melonis]|jgi:ferritin-like metal-binding protein YciE|uniref:Ferritin-like metal-binding protein YciE n=1 Tax=Sphingomonas melonis TaxID=152682 RepID=A0A7Y9FMZ0_9SPHN|nr:ferritin-like domain-containing protein [Sphingomonas melonis]NYD90265.1 ferritin-like metal-binding protein YciE [Sphingomonas melonis]
MATTAPTQDIAQELFVTGLKNAHGVEHQALALIDRQLDHLENYPEVAEMLRLHRGETEQQISRIDEILAGFDARPSAIKDLGLSITGNMAAIAHVFAPDEILKNSFANYAFENFEIASYTGLLTLAELGNFTSQQGLLRESLSEEQRMATWVLESLPGITRKYAGLRAAGETASH